MIETIILTGLLVAACISSEESEPEPQDATPPDGKTQQSKDAAIPKDGTTPKDAAVPTDSYQSPDAPWTPDAGVPPMLKADANITPGSHLAIFATDYATGLFVTLNLDPLGTPINRGTIASGDVILRSHQDKLYAIDRTNDLIKVFDSDFESLAQWIVGPGNPDEFERANPQDLVILPDETKAYVTRLDAQTDPLNQDDLWIINPNTGGFLDSRDLTPYTTNDGDRLARAAQMVLVGAKLYVVIQDLSSAFAADTNGKVVVINTTTDQVGDVIPLSCRNPADITYSEILDRIFVSCTGVYNPDSTIDTATPYGGIERINPNTNMSEGIFVDDADLGGAVSEIRLAAGDLGYVITNDTSTFSFKIASFNPETGAVISTNVYTSPWYYLPDFTIDAAGQLLIADPAVGMIVGDEEPITIEMLSTSITFLP